MDPEKLYIKNMVCPRCVWAVESVLKELNIAYSKVTIGEVLLDVTVDKIDTIKLNNRLHQFGFELVEERKKQIAEKIKGLAIYWVREASEEERQLNFSHFLADAIGKDYRYLSSVFSEIEHLTIEKFVIQLKIERIKEYLVYEDQNLSEIAFEMGYSSAAHLSGQFKQITGMSPKQFREMIKK